MATISQLMDKHLRGQPLLEDEIQQVVSAIASYGNATEKVNTWSENGTQARFINPELESPIWGITALSNSQFDRDADLTVLNNTETYITFDTKGGEQKSFRLDPDDLSKLIIYSGQSFQISGIVRWTANATGYRGVFIEGFKSDGTSIGTGTLATFPGFAGVTNTFPYGAIIGSNVFPEVTYYKFKVIQTSGGDLDLLSFGLGLHVT